MLVELLNDVGIVFQYSPSSKSVYPTQLMMYLSGISGVTGGTGANITGTSTSSTSAGASTSLVSPASSQTPSSHPDPNIEAALHPSPLALAVLKTVDDTDRFLIVETSFKVYGFTRDPLKIALLSFVADLEYRLPNMVVARITRRSFRRALLNGLNTHTVMTWLRAHTHNRTIQVSALLSGMGVGPGMTGASAANQPSAQQIASMGVPPNVVAQAKIWEEERTRLVVKEAVMIKDFDSVAEYENWRRFTERADILLHHDSNRQILVITKDGLRAVQKEKMRLDQIN